MKIKALAAVFSALFALRAFAGDVVLQALQDELKRSMDKLKMENFDKPFFISYTAETLQSLNISASFGSIVKSENEKSCRAAVDLRVGDYAFDNSNFGGDNFMTVRLPVDHDYDAVRYELWLITDRQYKMSLSELAKKHAEERTRVVKERPDDFSREQTAVSATEDAAPVLSSPLTQDEVGNISAVFRNYPAINNSDVSLNVNTYIKYFINSEGAVIRKPRLNANLYVEASTQADDGMRLNDFRNFLAYDGAGFQRGRKSTRP